MKKLLIVLILCILAIQFVPQRSIGQALEPRFPKSGPIPAAYRTQVYLPLLKGKRVGIFANHTATVGNKHLVDTLLVPWSYDHQSFRAGTWFSRNS
jgi:hypothetical protein